MRELSSTFPRPPLADAVKLLRVVQMAWNNTHSRRETNTWEAFDVVLAHCEEQAPPLRDWRASEEVKQARLAVIRAAEEWEGNPHGADTHDALDALCDAVANLSRASKEE